MSDIVDRDSGELHYHGKVDAPIGSKRGPGLDGRVWEVTGSVYDEEANRTTVYFDKVDL